MWSGDSLTSLKYSSCSNLLIAVGEKQPPGAGKANTQSKTLAPALRR
jgi:hypothetical protein